MESETQTSREPVERVFVIDHMCARPTGHNLGSVQIHEKEMRKIAPETKILVAKDLQRFGGALGADCVLNYPYNMIVETRMETNCLVRSLVKSKKNLSLLSKMSTWLEGIYYRMQYAVSRVDPVREKTKRNWKAVFRKYGLGAKDLLFLPSADYYGAISLLDTLSKLSPSEAPRIHFRFIGVMEDSSGIVSGPWARLVHELKQAIGRGMDIVLSAELPKYAQYLENTIGFPVIYLPYPVIREIEPFPQMKEVIVSSPGQGRVDKGFFLNVDIAKELFVNNMADRVLLRIQNMNELDRSFRYSYQEKLKAVPCVELLPAHLSAGEMHDVMVKANIYLLPYDRNVYRYRSSAIYQEAISYGRPVVAAKGTGFEELVRKYGNGKVAETPKEFAQCIQDYAARDPAALMEDMNRARDYYRRDYEKGLNAIRSQALGCHAESWK